MPREATLAVDKASKASEVVPVLFAYMDFPDEPVYVWSGIGQIQWDGNTWYGVGDLGAVTEVPESTDMYASPLTVTMTISEEATRMMEKPYNVLKTAFDTHFQGRDLKLWQAFLDYRFNIVPDPVLVWWGRMDQPRISADNTGTRVSISAEHELVSLHRPNEVRYTAEYQRKLFPDDLGFQYVNNLQERKIIWGGRVFNE